MQDFLNDCNCKPVKPVKPVKVDVRVVRHIATSTEMRVRLYRTPHRLSRLARLLLKQLHKRKRREFVPKDEA